MSVEGSVCFSELLPNKDQVPFPKHILPRQTLLSLALEAVHGFDTPVGFSPHIPVPKIPWHEWQVVLGSCWREERLIPEPLGPGWCPGPGWQLPLAWPPAGNSLGRQHPRKPPLVWHGHSSSACLGQGLLLFLSAFMSHWRPGPSPDAV